MTTIPAETSVFEALESEVRSYCRGWPTVFDRAQGSRMYDEDGHVYLDFFAGAGSLNYGHNNAVLKRALLDYLERDGVVHGLDMSTTAKRAFLETFRDLSSFHNLCWKNYNILQIHRMPLSVIGDVED